MVETLIDTIRKKKELEPLSVSFVTEKCDAYLATHPEIKKTLIESSYNPRSQVFRQVVKEVRAQLREIYGVFQLWSLAKREALLEKLKIAQGRGQKIAIIDALLGSHTSTRERKEHYQEMYQKIFALTNKPKVLLDLGCGMNPLSHFFLSCNPEYVACDVSAKEMKLIQKFFDMERIFGKTLVVDLLKSDDRKKYFSVQADVVLMFKLVDTLETQKRNITKTLLDELVKHNKPSHIVVSFATKSIGGKKLRTGSKENWFSRLLKQEGLSWQIVEIPGEEFWVISVHK